MSDHGTYAAYVHGCRCTTCKRANRQAMAKWKRRQHDARALVGDVLIAPVPTERHGLASTYRNHGCRCGPCTEANTEAGRARRRRFAGGAA